MILSNKVLCPLARWFFRLTTSWLRGKVLIGSDCSFSSSSMNTVLSCPVVPAFVNCFAGSCLFCIHSIWYICQHNYHVTCEPPYRFIRSFLLSLLLCFIWWLNYSIWVPIKQDGIVHKYGYHYRGQNCANCMGTIMLYNFKDLCYNYERFMER